MPSWWTLREFATMSVERPFSRRSLPSAGLVDAGGRGKIRIMDNILADSGEIDSLLPNSQSNP